MSENDDGKFTNTQDAWDKAQEMLDGSPTDETPSAEVEETPEADPVENVDSEQLAEKDDIPTKISDLVKEEEQPTADKVVDSTPQWDRETLLNINGEDISLGELIDGRMRDKDYTQGKQALADESRRLEKADELYTMLQGDTVGTIAQLALEANLIDEAQFNEVAKSTVNPKTRSLLADDNPADLEKQISEAVQAQLQSVLNQNPALRQVADDQRKAQILQTLDEIGTRYNQTLDDDDRSAILQKAVDENEPNLELVFLRLQSQLEASRANVARIEDAAGGKQSVTNLPKEMNVRPKSTAEAFELAEQKLSLRGG